MIVAEKLQRSALAATVTVLLACALALPLAAEPSTSEPAKATRVATLLPYVGEAILRADPSVQLVASVANQSGDPLPEGVIDLGSPHAPNLEQLALSRPDVVVADVRFHRSLTEPLSQSGAKLVLVNGSSINATFDGLREVARVVGNSEGMLSTIETSRAKLVALHLVDSPKVLPLFGSPGSYMAITPRTWLGDLLEEVGFHNVAADLVGRETFPGYVQISEEVLMTLDPATVLLVTHGSPQAVLEDFQRQAERGGPWKRFADHVLVLDPDRFAANPGLDLPLAAAELITLVAEQTTSR
ncbi:MAG: ABC transporter substrate-binding protein [Thermoanaerobaculia bacterium]|nr:ABC transporter substrate-binding protein [Thermoanaerobaculia bacterium]